MPLKYLKEYNTVETAEFALVRGIADEAVFAWWVPYTLKKRDVIIGKVQAKFKKRLTNTEWNSPVASKMPNNWIGRITAVSGAMH